ncbi:MAG: hypothetical protein GX997_09150 [Bacteroidales bacterium]|nr:hypothetical protein [Bacteroidales bacterium]
MKKYDVTDFLVSESFLDYVINKSDVAVEYWERTLRQLKHEYPELADIAKTAEKIILFENEDKSCLYQDESEDLKKRIIFSIQKNVKI